MTTKNTTINPNKLQLALKIVGLAWASFYVIAAVSQQFFPIDPDSLMGLFFCVGAWRCRLCLYDLCHQYTSGSGAVFVGSQRWPACFSH